MLRTRDVDRSHADAATGDDGARPVDLRRIAAAVRPSSPCCRSSGGGVADSFAPKSRSTSHLRLVSPKTRWATERPTRQHATQRATAGVSQKPTPTEEAKTKAVGQHGRLGQLAEQAQKKPGRAGQGDAKTWTDHGLARVPVGESNDWQNPRETVR